MAKIIVLAGGTSTEREVSLRSSQAVVAALKAKGHTVATLDPADGLDSLLPEFRTADIVFPALHGSGGEDGVLQKFLEQHHIRYVGSDSRASALCLDKIGYTELLRKHNFLLPATEAVTFEQYEASVLRQGPFVLKPIDGGSSIDMFIVRRPADAVETAIKSTFRKYERMLLQEFIEGVEVTAGVMGKQALPVIEIIPPKGEYFDYENKYNGETQELCPPVHVGEAIQAKIQETARAIHELTGCRDMSRTDLIIAADDRQYVLETNTIPGLTGESLLPKAAAEAGYDMPALCDQLVKLALQHDT
ncbi:MAG TPA: D-alanine--D-alanine ligase [Candidatus Saccharimonadales bacterium]|nr:D-alanine--D-alanine ligase [Candidatus Saccharimonadales bacterium]